MMRGWQPPWQAVQVVFDRPPVGSLVAHDFRALEVVGYHEREADTVARVRRVFGPRFPQEHGDDREVGLSFAGRIMWRVYVNGRVPLCSCHGEPWPCRVVCEEDAAAHHLRVMADQIGKADDGACYSCGAPVSSRQRTVVAPEPNVELPGFGPPVFHLRRACRAGLERYDGVRRAVLGDGWVRLVTDPDSSPL